LSKLQNELEEYQILTVGFDDENLTNNCKKSIDIISTEYTCMRQLWVHIKLTNERTTEI